MATLAVALACGGCMRATAVDSAVTEGAKVKPRAHFFWFGTLGEEDVDVRRLCDGPAARVQIYDDLLTLLTSFASFGIYTPRRVEVVCAAKTGAGSGGS
jgi:hypothetical protein